MKQDAVESRHSTHYITACSCVFSKLIFCCSRQCTGNSTQSSCIMWFLNTEADKRYLGHTLFCLFPGICGFSVSRIEKVGYGVGVRCVHRRALAVNCSPPPTFELYRRFVRCGGGGDGGGRCLSATHSYYRHVPLSWKNQMVKYKSTFRYTNPNNASCKVLSFAQLASSTLDIVIRYLSCLYQPL